MTETTNGALPVIASPRSDWPTPETEPSPCWGTDPELAVMALLMERLEGLEERARVRVIRWLADRFGTWK